ncbi:oligopeptide ABC transporter permease [Jeotgalibacillus proteolyticus]|uniref:Peptide ABC transporter permease n=1 Tax=Jeotgalibacillus proteolyticus TaxID=2082395 RepID=A0A2S5GHJ6_9BACL|nr:oligopeptide ABC transporter permease [Jeotgalibacillus proteolyticus]PPA72333.1 peptide ABC transporter permease [Jeotgalibacillus proteolyticus]
MVNPIKRIPKEMFEPKRVDESLAEKIEKPSLSFWQDAWLRVKKNKAAIVSVVVLTLLIIMALIGPYLSGHTVQQNVEHANLPPRIAAVADVSWLPFDGTLKNRDGAILTPYEDRQITESYWFGTDSLGRDLFTRLWLGVRISLFIAFLATAIDMVIGVSYGAISGYFGGRVDNIMQRIIEILSGIPNLVIVILLILILEPGILAITLALALTGWVTMARVVRGQVLKLKNQEFALASKTLGATDYRIIFKHLMPNMVGVIIVNMMFTIPSAIFFEAFLSFIGLGLKPPNASLGTLIEDGFRVMLLYPYMLIIPSIVISLLMVTFNLLGDGLRDALDPKMRD